MEFLDIAVSLLALIILEIILGIDNLVFLSILTEKLPREQRKKGTALGAFLRVDHTFDVTRFGRVDS